MDSPARTEQGSRRGRADRILDAAASLILRWGYNKTTVDDIARHAGVAKGTIYLHWKTREDLFAALMLREQVALEEDYKRRIAADPEGSTLRGIYRHAALALMQRPLLKAMLLRDTDLLGKLALSDYGSAAYEARVQGFKAYLELLRACGMVRTDLSLDAQVYMVNAIFIGFFLTAPLMPAELKPSDEELADLMAETVHRALELPRRWTGDELEKVADAYKQYLEGITATDAARLRGDAKA